MTTQKDMIAKEGYPIVLGSGVAGLVAIYFNVYAGVVLLLWTAFCIYFFRNPKREWSQNPDLLICPADGKIIGVGKAKESHFLNKEMNRITIFMSPFDVHVNRVPESGTVLGQVHHHGKFLAAFDERASEENERSAIHLKTESGLEIVFVQIAGWFARRIVSYPKIGDCLQRGNIFGVIKFGSRMDIFYPDDFEPSVKMGERVKAGQSVIAKKKAVVSVAA